MKKIIATTLLMLGASSVYATTGGPAGESEACSETRSYNLVNTADYQTNLSSLVEAQSRFLACRGDSTNLIEWYACQTTHQQELRQVVNPAPSLIPSTLSWATGGGNGSSSGHQIVIRETRLLPCD